MRTSSIFLSATGCCQTIGHAIDRVVRSGIATKISFAVGGDLSIHGHGSITRNVQTYRCARVGQTLCMSDDRSALEHKTLNRYGCVLINGNSDACFDDPVFIFKLPYIGTRDGRIRCENIVALSQ
ncbi:hypothetical protein D3C72_1618620 [compost metagenome]